MTPSSKGKPRKINVLYASQDKRKPKDPLQNCDLALAVPIL
jgi:hypothetical protein